MQVDMAKDILEKQKGNGSKKDKKKKKKKHKKASSTSSSSESESQNEEDFYTELAMQVGLKSKQMKVKDFVRLDQLSAET